MEILKDLKSQIASYYSDIIVLLPRIGIALLISFSILIIARFFRRRVVHFMNAKADDPLLVNFLNGAIRIMNLIIGFLIFLTVMGLTGVAGSILGAASVSAVVIGFAFKDIAENFLAGVIMAFKRPFRVGDTIKTGDVEGNIISMSLRDSCVKTFDGKDVFVPNAQILKNPLYNYTIDGFLRKKFTIGLDYGSDIEQARKVIEEVVNGIDGILKERKKVRTTVGSLSASTINIDIYYWIDTFDNTYSPAETQSQAISKVLSSLESAGFNLPGDIVELKNYGGGKLMTSNL